MEELVKYFREHEVKSILDVGTGSGDFIAVLKNVFPQSKITGIDPDKESLQEAAKKYPDVSFHEMVSENLEFAENTFDLASISMALHHLPDIQASLKEMQRVVKNGGWIIVNELFSDNLNQAQEVHKMFHHFRSQIDRLTGVCHNSTLERAQIIDMIQKSGIDIQFYFDNKIETNLIESEGELEARIDKMKQHIEKIRELPEYEVLKIQIDEFREKAGRHGFQPATRVVVVGNVQ